MPRDPRNQEGKLAVALRNFERDFIARELRAHGGHVGNTATALGVPRRTLIYRMGLLGLTGEASALRAEAGIKGPRPGALDPASDA